MELLRYCENYLKLHPEQMGNWKERSTINTVAALVYKVEEKWENKKQVAVLFIDINYYVSKKQLLT